MTQRIVPPMDDPPTWHNPGVRVLDSDTSEPRSVKAVKLVVYAAEHDGAFVVPKLRNVVITLCCDAEGEYCRLVQFLSCSCHVAVVHVHAICIHTCSIVALEYIHVFSCF